ncbi:MAG: type IV pilus twitching motility protein PilT [Verrucomicrobiia bacterium]|jgi:twitching motility protein PilT
MAEMSEDQQYFNEILKTGVGAGCSDIHIKAGTPATFRISTALQSIDFTPDQTWMASVIKGICPPHLYPSLEADRETDFSYQIEGVGRFRTNVFQALGRWCIVMRYVKSEPPNLEKLGLPDILSTIAESERGIILLAGTTGSGKSTTMAAMLEHINTHFRRHIVTLEDPIEFVFGENQCVIEQREVTLDTMTFQRGLKSALRQDPDIIMVGEMRDAISFKASINAADTGHMVMSTMHTTNAASSPGRILEYFPPEERESVRKQLAGTLYAIIAQRMCSKVDGGMIPAQEIFINSSTMRKALEEGEFGKIPSIIESSRDDGMQSFNQCCYDLCMSGVISKETALEKATNAQAVAMMFEGIFLSSGGIVG